MEAVVLTILHCFADARGIFEFSCELLGWCCGESSEGISDGGFFAYDVIDFEVEFLKPFHTLSHMDLIDCCKVL